MNRHALREALQTIGFSRTSYTDRQPDGSYIERWTLEDNAIEIKWGAEVKSPLQVALSAEASCGCGVNLLTSIQKEEGRCKDCLHAMENAR